MVKEIIFAFDKMSIYEILTLVLSVIGILVGLGIGWIQISIMKSLKPALHGKILHMMGTTITPLNQTGLLISASIANLGSATIVERYSIEITLADQTITKTYIPSILPKSIKGEHPAIFEEGSALYDQTVHIIATGDQAVGWLMFILPDVDKEKLTAAGTRIVLVYHDIKGKKYKSEPRLFRGVNDGSFSYVPGTGMPFQKNNQSNSS